VKTIYLVLSFFITSAAFAKVIKEGTKEYEDFTSWNIGDEVEGIGKVVKKTIKGKEVYFAFDKDGIKIEFRYTKL
jgi:hypothetical protein